MYCPYCDARIKKRDVCPKCGEMLEISERSGIVTLLTAFFLGVFGAHNLYTGYYALAIFQCLLSILFCWSIVVPVAVWVWSMIEAIFFIAGRRYDPDGRVLR